MVWRTGGQELRKLGDEESDVFEFPLKVCNYCTNLIFALPVLTLIETILLLVSKGKHTPMCWAL